jgi:hypothetical protein
MTLAVILDSVSKASLNTRGRSNYVNKIEAQDHSCGVPVSMSSPRSMSRAGLTAPLGPISASATFSMRSRLACMKLNRLFHSDFWMPLNWYSCRATQQTVSLVTMQQLSSVYCPMPWSSSSNCAAQILTGYVQNYDCPPSSGCRPVGIKAGHATFFTVA